MAGELTLEMLDSDGMPVPWNVATMRSFNKLDPAHVAKLLEAAAAAEFFTRPEPTIDADLSTVAFRVRIAWQGRTRELDIGEPNTDPTLERVARAACACVRDRQVFALKSMPDDERRAFLAALLEVDMPEKGQLPD